MTEWISAFLGLSISFVIIIFIRRDRLLVRHGLGWILAAGVVMAVGLYPQSVDLLASWVGVAYPPTIALLLGFGALTLKTLISDIELSKTEVKVTRLVQRLAVLEFEVNRLQRSSTDQNAESRYKPPKSADFGD